MHTISVALCTYNGERFLDEQLHSIALQSRQPDELIAFDDRSNDTTVEILRRFSQTAPFPVTIRVNETNLGSTRNFEAAIRACSCDLIFLCDQDDVWEPRKIKTLAARFERAAVGAAFSNASLIDDKGQILHRTLWDSTFPEYPTQRGSTGGLYQMLLERNVITGATMAFRRSLAMQALPFPRGLPDHIHDGWLALVLSMVSEVEAVDLPLIRYRLHVSQQLGLGAVTAPTASATDVRLLFQSEAARFESEAETAERLRRYLARAAGGTSERASGADRRLQLKIDELRERAGHLRNRVTIFDANGSARARLVFKEYRSRGYRFSKGILSALKDLFYRPRPGAEGE